MKLRHLLGVLSLGLIMNMGAVNALADTVVKVNTQSQTAETANSTESGEDPNTIKNLTAGKTAAVKKMADAGWRNDGRWWYQYSDGSYPKAQWRLINGLWYYFDDAGYMLENTWVQGMYYVGSTGAMLTDTTTPDGYRVGSDGAWISDESADSTKKPKISSNFTRYTSKIKLYEVNGKLQMYLQGMDMSFIQASERSEFKVFDSYYTVSNVYFMNYNRASSSYTRSVGPITVYINKDADILLPDGSKTTASAYYEEHQRLSVEGDLFKATAIQVGDDGYVLLMDFR